MYNVEVLKKMIATLNVNIEMFSRYDDEQANKRMWEMVKERRDLAALVENNGVRDKHQIVPDSMAYSAANGADTSWWTRGT